MTIHSFNEKKLRNQICNDAYIRYCSSYHLPEDRQFTIREIIFLENFDNSRIMKQLYAEGMRMDGSKSAKSFSLGKAAVEQDLYYKAYGEKAPMIVDDEPDVHSFLNAWTDAEGRLRVMQ